MMQVSYFGESARKFLRDNLLPGASKVTETVQKCALISNKTLLHVKRTAAAYHIVKLVTLLITLLRVHKIFPVLELTQDIEGVSHQNRDRSHSCPRLWCSTVGMSVVL
jgi:hypothetical protein